MVITKTFRARISNTSGFTLIEIMFVMAIIAFVVGIGIPRLGKNLGSQVRTLTRKIVVLNKDLHHMSRLRNKTYRLAISFGDATHAGSMWVESANSKQLLDPPDATPTPQPHTSLDKPPPAGPFSTDTELLKKPIVLPDAVKFEDVEIDPKGKPIQDGRAYIHFFPEGLVQEAVIHIGDGKTMHWSLVIEPLTGYTDVIEGEKHLKDIAQ
jgi:prepilin-type N-terminal cleavage/methylation domain-containing protein